MTQISLPKLGICTGDPAGVGPEICIKLLDEKSVCDVCTPIVFGDRNVWEFYSRQLNIDPDLEFRKFHRDLDLSNIERPTLVDFGNVDMASFKFAEVSAVAGHAAFSYIDSAIHSCLSQTIDAMVTGPINKLSLHAAGYDFPGHTEILAEKTDTTDFCMMQYSDELTCSFATTHIGYGQVVEALSVDRIVDVISLTHNALQLIKGQAPSLVVCGLNPHAGEDGLFGNREEERIIVPAVEVARSNGIDVSGPFPPDTCFIPSKRKTTDGFICMYHDQGHIPLKALVFDKAVNVTLGLPIVRTSVDHGTAFDIVGKKVADFSSLRYATLLASKLSKRRLANDLTK